MRSEQSQEPLTAIFATQNEVIAVSAAVSHYRTWLARSPESTNEFREVITLLDTFQQRLSQDGGVTPTRK